MTSLLTAKTLPVRECCSFLRHRLGRSHQCKHIRLTPVRIPVRMVEGPQCHRVAHTHRKMLKGHAFKAVSPNKRFTEGAQAIDSKPLTRIEVHGKNLFYFFGEGAEAVVMHIHFGMSGHFRISPAPGPEPTPTTRLRLTNEKKGIVAHLSAMTVQHGDVGFYEKQSGKIGPDPLREDADVETVWEKVQRSKKPIGLILMDQSMMAGIGNIYRAEILFKAGVHPEQPGHSIDRAAFERIWRHSVLLLQRGFKEGSILTVDPEEANILGPPWTRRYIYNHPRCGRCKGMVEVWDMAARTVYACPRCQPLLQGTQLAASRSQALGKASPHKRFKSTCAPEPETAAAPKQLTAAGLRAKLKSLGKPTQGKKAELVARLGEAAAALATQQEASVTVPPESAAAVVVKGAPKDENDLIEVAMPPKKRKPGGGSQAFTAVLATEDDIGETVSRELPKPGLPAKGHLDGLTIPMLKAELQKLGLPTSGRKSALATRLQAAKAEARDSPATHGEGSPPVKLETAAKSESPPVVETGTRAVGDVATAEEAEAEKQAAGEGKNVEHVALQIDRPQAVDATTACRRVTRKRKARA